MKLICHRNGDYLLPNLGLTEEEQRPLGRYGRMGLRDLREYRPGLYTRLLLSGKLMEHLQENDSICQERREQRTCGGHNGRSKGGETGGMGTAQEHHPPPGRGDSSCRAGFCLKGGSA